MTCSTMERKVPGVMFHTCFVMRTFNHWGFRETHIYPKVKNHMTSYQRIEEATLDKNIGSLIYHLWNFVVRTVALFTQYGVGLILHKSCFGKTLPLLQLKDCESYQHVSVSLCSNRKFYRSWRMVTPEKLDQERNLPRSHTTLWALKNEGLKLSNY